MIFNTGKIYAKVWKIKYPDNGKYIDLNISTSEKDQDGEYKNSSWFPRCIGKSVNTLKGLKEEDRILITKSKFTNERVQQEDGTYKSYFRFLIIEAELENEEENSPSPSPTENKTSKNKGKKSDTPKEKNDGAEEDCPW